MFLWKRFRRMWVLEIGTRVWESIFWLYLFFKNNFSNTSCLSSCEINLARQSISIITSLAGCFHLFWCIVYLDCSFGDLYFLVKTWKTPVKRNYFLETPWIVVTYCKKQKDPLLILQILKCYSFVFVGVVVWLVKLTEDGVNCQLSSNSK